jgi:hypothetical protein
MKKIFAKIRPNILENMFFCYSGKKGGKYDNFGEFISKKQKFY